MPIIKRGAVLKFSMLIDSIFLVLFSNFRLQPTFFLSLYLFSRPHVSLVNYYEKAQFDKMFPIDTAYCNCVSDAKCGILQQIVKCVPIIQHVLFSIIMHIIFMSILEVVTYLRTSFSIMPYAIPSTCVASHE